MASISSELAAFSTTASMFLFISPLNFFIFYKDSLSSTLNGSYEGPLGIAIFSFSPASEFWQKFSNLHKLVCKLDGVR